jgi:DNA-binding NarL/FixJ family response regulator
MTPSVARRTFEVLRQPGPPGLAAPTVPTEEEKELLSLVKQGMSNKEIADRLDLSPQTVANKLTAIYKKLHMTRDGRKILKREGP